MGPWAVNGTGYLYVLEFKLSQFDKPIQFHTIDMVLSSINGPLVESGVGWSS